MNSTIKARAAPRLSPLEQVNSLTPVLYLIYDAVIDDKLQVMVERDHLKVGSNNWTTARNKAKKDARKMLMMVTKLWRQEILDLEYVHNVVLMSASTRREKILAAKAWDTRTKIL